MNSLFNTCAALRKTAIALILIATFAVTAAAQTVNPMSQGRMYGEPGFVGEPIDLKVVNADIRDILTYITDEYGINFVIDRSVKEVPVTVTVNRVPWNIALDSILQAQELGVQVVGNILRIADNKTLRVEGENFRIRQSNQLDSTPLLTEIVRLNYARAKDGVVQGDTSSGRSVGGINETQGGFNGQAYSEIPTISSPASGVSGSGGTVGILPIIQRRLSRRGSIEVDGRSNSLIITDVATNLAAIKQLIAILDQPEPQVEIEARIVIASRNFSRDIGVQISGLVIGNGRGASFGTLPGATTTLPVPPSLPIPNLNNGLGAQLANTAIGLTTGIFGTAQLSALITLGEQRGQAKVIATPRVTALNNQPAEIRSSTQIPITTIQPGSGGGFGVATTTYIDVPLRLAITPQITDMGTVILNVVAENSSTSTIVPGAPPAINTQSMTTHVTVPDGGTTVVGGVLFDDERDAQDRTPGLASIPLLGNLFKRNRKDRNTNEILFFITPRITRPDYAALSTGPPRPPTIIQPVPMGNPPSNSTPALPTPQPVMLQSPGLTRPELVPVTSDRP